MSLIIAGLGIKFLSHLTKETEKIITDSDKVFYLANDALFPEWIKICNKNSESLEELYFSKPNRCDSYTKITDKILSEVDIYQNICFVIYGNPNFLVQVTSLVSSAARHIGHDVHILPAISSLDCLLADMNINPGESGMQIFEATDLLIYRKAIDITSHVVIFQPAAIGQNGHNRNKDAVLKGLTILCDYLGLFYGGEQEIIFYEASQCPGKKPLIISTILRDASQVEISSISTMYLSPSKKGERCQITVNKIKSISADFNTSSEKSSI